MAWNLSFHRIKNTPFFFVEIAHTYSCQTQKTDSQYKKIHCLLLIAKSNLMHEIFMNMESGER